MYILEKKILCTSSQLFVVLNVKFPTEYSVLWIIQLYLELDFINCKTGNNHLISKKVPMKL